MNPYETYRRVSKEVIDERNNGRRSENTQHIPAAMNEHACDEAEAADEARESKTKEHP